MQVYIFLVRDHQAVRENEGYCGVWVCVSVCFTYSRSGGTRSTNVTILSGGTLGRKMASLLDTQGLVFMYYRKTLEYSSFKR